MPSSRPIGTDILKTDSITRVVEGQVMQGDRRARLQGGARRSKDANGNVVGKDKSELPGEIRDQPKWVKAPATPARDMLKWAPPPTKAAWPVTFVTVRRPPRCINTNEVLEKLQKTVTGYPGVVVPPWCKNADGPPVGKPINIEIRGKEIEGLLDEAENA
jgi:hypothetical protein